MAVFPWWICWCDIFSLLCGEGCHGDALLWQYVFACACAFVCLCVCLLFFLFWFILYVLLHLCVYTVHFYKFCVPDVFLCESVFASVYVYVWLSICVSVSLYLWCVSVCVFVVCPSWTGSRSPRRSGPCATCCGPTPWKTLATRRPRSTLATTQSEAAPISTGTRPNYSSHGPSWHW